MPRREDATVSDRCSPKDRREAEGFALRRKGDPMTDINAKGLSRRAFFGLGATAAAGAAVAGLAGCSPAPQSDAAAPATTARGCGASVSLCTIMAMSISSKAPS